MDSSMRPCYDVERREASSQSNYLEAWAEHMEMDIAFDFESKKLKGSVMYTVVRGHSQVNTFVVDTAGGMKIFGVSVDGIETEFEMKAKNPIFGQAVVVALGKTEKISKVRFDFETGNECAAAQWLTAEQTEAKMPFLFTQSQAIHARSLFPCQDAPGAKLTWSGRLSCPKWATALASGLKLGEEVRSDHIISRWHQPVKMSTYLIAFACGVMEFRDLSDRCRVWAEPTVINDAAYDFADTEQFLSLAEDITKMPYAWTRYDLVCLPASFPYGGMENCNLNFVTPTLLAGDRSLAGVVAHEIAHSWTGNLVTNATWNSFWLNEGWTRWLERNILARKHAQENLVRRKQLIDFDRAMARGHLAEDVALFQERNKEDLTHLVPRLEAVDPDDAFSSVPYEKGSGFLHYLEHRVGSDKFLIFFQSYLKAFAHSTITSREFANYFQKHFPEEYASLDWETWFFTPGNCPVEAPIDTTLVDQVKTLAAASTQNSLSTIDNETINSWPTDLKSFFLDTLLAIPDHELNQKLPLSTLEALDHRFQFSKGNSELRFRFCRLLLKTSSPRALPLALHLATTQGRMKFVRPLYRAVCACPVPGSLDAAITSFQSHEFFYHPICRKLVAADLQHAIKLQLQVDEKRRSVPFMKLALFSAASAILFILLNRRRSTV